MTTLGLRKEFERLLAHSEFLIQFKSYPSLAIEEIVNLNSKLNAKNFVLPGRVIHNFL